jgi:methylphosphotriester-DNA--protein-cysteine methyltransferase
MIRHSDIARHDLIKRIQQGEITLAGNRRLKIFGKLTCSSGKRMKKENRVFFKDTSEALGTGFRPCGHCLKLQYKQWKLKAKS